MFLRLNEDLGFLEYWCELDQPMLSAVLSNRPPVVNGETEMPHGDWEGCWGGPPLTVPARFVLPAADAVDLFAQFLRNGLLPERLGSPTPSVTQQSLPGFPEESVSEDASAAVRWFAPWSKFTRRHLQDASSHES
jgi:hypothetical protein